MKTPLFLLAAAVLLATATGCETTLDLPEPPHTPRVALTYTLTTAPQDSSFQELYQQRQLFISNSQRVFDTTRLRGRPDAAAELRDAAGNVVERFRPLRGSNPEESRRVAGSYRPVLGFRPVPGRAYTLRASLPGLPPVESTLTLPLPTIVESAAYAPRPGSTGGVSNVFRGRLTLTLRDDPATPNYYLAYARALDQEGKAGKWSAVVKDIQGEDDNDSRIERFRLSEATADFRRDLPFADAGLNGQLITLTADTYFTAQNCFSGNCPQPAFLEVYVSSIPAADYNFYLARRRYEESNGNFFAEPAPLASNVRGGYGLFGGATDVIYRIRL